MFKRLYSKGLKYILMLFYQHNLSGINSCFYCMGKKACFRALIQFSAVQPSLGFELTTF